MDHQYSQGAGPHADYDVPDQDVHHPLAMKSPQLQPHPPSSQPTGPDDDVAVHDETHEVVLTETVQSGIMAMQHRRASIEQQIDDLVAQGLEFIEQLKSKFIASMERIKSELASYAEGQEGQWRETSHETQEAYARLDNARQLVRSLGLQAERPGGM